LFDLWLLLGDEPYLELEDVNLVHRRLLQALSNCKKFDGVFLGYVEKSGINNIRKRASQAEQCGNETYSAKYAILIFRIEVKSSSTTLVTVSDWKDTGKEKALPYRLFGG
jgi:hypothetical protein